MRSKITKKGICCNRENRYQSPTYRPANGLYKQSKAIYENHPADAARWPYVSEIEEKVKGEGYIGTSPTICMFATHEKKLFVETKDGSREEAERIERRSLISLLCKPIDLYNYHNYKIT